MPIKINRKSTPTPKRESEMFRFGSSPALDTSQTTPALFEFGSKSASKAASKTDKIGSKLRSILKKLAEVKEKNSRLQRDLDAANEEIARLRSDLEKKDRELEEIADAKLLEAILADKERAETEIRSRSPKKIM
jgi:septal ring factor EnvC (AmiA/AmiB activator)